jgi:hypothetical protein
MDDILADANVDRVSCLMILQNPVEDCYQIWVEEVKKGVHADLDSLEKSYYNYDYPKRIVELLNLWKEDSRVNVQLLNQGVCAEELPRHVLNWLGMSEEDVPVSMPLPSDRRLTISEINFLLNLRKSDFDQYGKVVEMILQTSNAFSPQQFFPSAEIQEDLWMRNKPYVELMNQWMYPGHQLIFDQKPHDPSILNNQVIDRSLFYRIHNLLMDQLLRSTAK